MSLAYTTPILSYELRFTQTGRVPSLRDTHRQTPAASSPTYVPWTSSQDLLQVSDKQQAFDIHSTLRRASNWPARLRVSRCQRTFLTLHVLHSMVALPLSRSFSTTVIFIQGLGVRMLTRRKACSTPCQLTSRAFDAAVPQPGRDETQCRTGSLVTIRNGACAIAWT